MQVNIIIPYRPLSTGGRVNPRQALHQNNDGLWEIESTAMVKAGRQDLYRAIHLLNKHSVQKHKIIIVIDYNVFPKDGWLKEYDNVKVIKSNYVYDKVGENQCVEPLCYMAAADNTGINSVSDDEWICYSFVEDLVPCEKWDEPILREIEKYGDKYVYVPMFVEAHGGLSPQYQIKGIQPTPGLIWDTWRRTQSCHSLAMPMPADRDYITLDDFEEYVRIAKSDRPAVVVEQCGARTWGYYNVIFMKAKIAKSVPIKIEFGFDLDFDNRLYSEAGCMKVVVTDSFVLHTMHEIRIPII